MILLTGASLIDWRSRVPRPNSTQILVKSAMVILICIEIRSVFRPLKKTEFEKKNKMTMWSLIQKYQIWTEISIDHCTLKWEVQNFD